jgi:hypothetical protein
MTTTYQTTTTGGSAAGIGTRIVLTLLGAAGMIVGSFLEWTRGFDGIDLDVRALWTTTFRSTGTFVASVGFVMIVIGLVAILGLAFGSGWLTRLAGAAGIAAFVLVAIQLYRSAGDDYFELGAWLTLGGAVVALVAGFFGPARSVVATPTPASSSNVVVHDHDDDH